LKILSREFSVVVAFSILSVYFYFLMEWVFFATKPSFMSSLALPEKISALVIPPGLFSIAFICAAALLRLVGGVAFGFYFSFSSPTSSSIERRTHRRRPPHGVASRHWRESSS
jgi:hypothetical protein